MLPELSFSFHIVGWETAGHLASVLGLVCLGLSFWLRLQFSGEPFDFGLFVFKNNPDLEGHEELLTNSPLTPHIPVVVTSIPILVVACMHVIYIYNIFVVQMICIGVYLYSIPTSTHTLIYIHMYTL